MATARPELSCYGKLPLHKEFLRLRCFRGAASLFRHWMDHGFEWASKQQGSGTPLRLTWQLLWYAEREKEAVVARLRDSSDSGGERKFPFACYATIPRKALSGELSTILPRLQPQWQAFAEADRGAADLGDATAFQETMTRWELPPIEDTAKASLNDIPLTTFMDGVVGEGQHDQFPRLLWGIRKACMLLLSNKLPAARAPLLKLPVASEPAALVQSCAWLRLLEKSNFFSQLKSPCTLAFPADSAGSLWVMTRPPRADDFSTLGSETDEYLAPPPGVTDAQVMGYTDFRADVEDQLLSPGKSLQDLASFRLGKLNP